MSELPSPLRGVGNADKCMGKVEDMDVTYTWKWNGEDHAVVAKVINKFISDWFNNVVVQNSPDWQTTC
ncbi:hypothetical protein ACFU8W_46800 [Streptomyces sp. NPDC057565]|uniref:hypothetical protein n=1 Tax=Streptomyces sp. NPDC057565 TaxID=3346169 RepID=UPI0036C8CBE6